MLCKQGETMKLRNSIGGTWAVASLLLCVSSLYAAQPAPPFSLEQLRIGLPEEGAPRAVVGPYAVTTETIQGQPGLLVYRPRDLANFPCRDTLPVVVWGNGGCAADNPKYNGFLSTIASHGFLVITTAAAPPQEGARPPRLQVSLRMRLLLGNLLFFCLVCFPHVLHTTSWPETDRARCSAAPPAPACWRSEVLGVSDLTRSGRALPDEKRLEARASLR